MQITINIVEEDGPTAQQMVATFAQHGFLSRTFGCVEDFLPCLNDPTPSISFVSFGLPRQGVKRVLERLKQGNLTSSIILTCDDLATSQIVELIKAGVEDILEKPFTSAQLFGVAQHLLKSPAPTFQTRLPQPGEVDGQLTNEEQQILSLMEQGATIKEIASKLDISVRTVHYRKASILEKTNCKNCTEVVSKIAAMRSGSTRPMVNPTPHLLSPISETPGTVIGLGGGLSAEDNRPNSIG